MTSEGHSDLMKNQKLELTWIGKDIQPKLEPRILIEDPDKSYGDRNTENMLIFGDNLLALKALEQEFAGRIKCIFIDPPYNTGSAFTHYDDGLEHSLWLTMMRDRLEILRRLLAEDGSIWITIDDNEAHYLKVLCDEIFGRQNFVISIAWQKVFAKKNKALISGSHDHILVVAKNINSWSRNLLPRDGSALSAFKNPDKDKRGLWQSVAYSVQSEDAERRKAYRYPICLPSGREVMPPTGRHWNGLPERTEELKADNRLWFGKDGDNPPRIKVFLTEVQDGIVPDTWWTHDGSGSNQDSKKEMLDLFPDTEPFSTPKPEKLLFRLLTIATHPGDLVLDSFAGSGTTGAVAHKMGRKWIMVELGEHCYTHIKPRLQKVCDGTDQGGISKTVSWQGGGGFKYYYMAPSLLKKDRYDQWIINEEYNPTMLAAAMAKHENFHYCPDEVYYWKQGQSSEKDFIFTTTVHLTPEHLDRIHEEMKPGESLLICCKSHFGGADGKYHNITVKKIPSMLLGKCEFDRDDYSLNIVDMPRNPDDPEFVPSGPLVEEKKEAKKPKADKSGQMDIFARTGE
jgi:adenine-specific DNA-methyltransferase